MEPQIPEDVKQSIDVSESFTGIFNTQEESEQYVNYLQESQYKVVVPNRDTLDLDGGTKRAIIIVQGEVYCYENGSEFYIAIGGKIEEEESIISTETIAVPVSSFEELQEVVQKLIDEVYTVFSPTQPGTPPPPGEVTGESKKIIFDVPQPERFHPQFPDIPSPIMPLPGEPSLWVVVAVRE